MSTALAQIPHSVGGARAAAAELWGKVQRSQQTMKRVREENAKRVEGMVDATLVVGTAFGISWANAKYGKNGLPVQIAGFDADVALGGLAFVAAVMEMGGKYNDQLYSVGSGALAAWAGRQGASVAAGKGVTITGVAAASQMRSVA